MITPSSTESLRRTDRDGDSSPRRIVVAHSEPLLCQTLAAQLASHDEFEVVALLDEPDGLLSTVAESKPDGALVPLADGDFRAQIPLLVEQHPEVAVIGLVPESDGDGAAEALAAGVTAIVPTVVSPASLRSAIAAATDGWMVIPPGEYQGVLTGVAAARSRLAHLDTDAVELLEAVVAGRTIAEVAEDGFVSARTVKRRLAALLADLRCESRTSAVELYGRAVLDGHGSDGDGDA